MTIAADMDAPLSELDRLCVEMASAGAISASVLMQLILTALRDCQERADFLERYQSIQRRPDIAEIEGGTVLILDAWRTRVRPQQQEARV